MLINCLWISGTFRISIMKRIQTLLTIVWKGGRPTGGEKQVYLNFTLLQKCSGDEWIGTETTKDLVCVETNTRWDVDLRAPQPVDRTSFTCVFAGTDKKELLSEVWILRNTYLTVSQNDTQVRRCFAYQSNT